MKVLICYYSGSGNTKLCCNYIGNKLRDCSVDLFDIVRDRSLNIDNYDVIGFATFTDLLAAPQKFIDFVDSLKQQNNKPAFVFNTFGFITGHTIDHMRRLVKNKGFSVLAGHALHVPENYPPMIRAGKGFEDAPNSKEMNKFNRFIDNLELSLASVNSDMIISHKIKIPFLFRLIPVFSRRITKKEFGIHNVKSELCRECGLCAKGCPYDAITMDPKPVFNHDKCHGCWYCYNICRNKAVYTPKFSGECQYPKPIDKLREKLKIEA